MRGRCHDRAPAAAVDQALRLIPSTMRPLVACEFIIGVDPVLAGIHDYPDDMAPPGFGYGDVAHCVHDYHQWLRPASERGTKVILPTNRDYGWDTWGGVHTVVHELGHVLHHRTDPGWEAEPVSDYAYTDRQEAFAEAFAAWVWGEPIDPRTDALLEGLA